MRDGTLVRRGEPADFDAALAVWRTAEKARRVGQSTQEQGDRAHVDNPEAFLCVAESGGEVVGMAVGMQGRADDGAGPPIRGLCHVGAVFVRPNHWDGGVGGALVDAVLAEARTRGYDRVRLWTHANNTRAHRLYASRHFARTGREKEDDVGEPIVHYGRNL